MNNKIRFPVVLMLAAGAVTSIVAYMRNFSFVSFMWVLVATLIVFYIIGRIFVSVIEKFDRENMETSEYLAREAAEGAVIEKVTAEDEQDMSDDEF